MEYYVLKYIYAVTTNTKENICSLGKYLLFLNSYYYMMMTADEYWTYL